MFIQVSHHGEHRPHSSGHPPLACHGACQQYIIAWESLAYTVVLHHLRIGQLMLTQRRLIRTCLRTLRCARSKRNDTSASLLFLLHNDIFSVTFLTIASNEKHTGYEYWVRKVVVVIDFKVLYRLSKATKSQNKLSARRESNQKHLENDAALVRSTMRYGMFLLVIDWLTGLFHDEWTNVGINKLI
jgi:hypothetical protein